MHAAAAANLKTGCHGSEKQKKNAKNSCESRNGENMLMRTTGREEVMLERAGSSFLVKVTYATKITAVRNASVCLALLS
jgi:hypothetical protein